MEEKHKNPLNTLLSVLDPFQVFRHHETDPNKQNGKPRRLKFTTSRSLEALIFLVVLSACYSQKLILIQQ